MPSPEGLKLTKPHLKMIVEGATRATDTEFNNTADLKPMKFVEATELPDTLQWYEGVKAEHGRFGKHKVWIPVPRMELSKRR
jgi:hypothetical protein